MTEKSAATVAKILARARTLFLKRTYAEVTMDHIASAAEVTKGALYHHFGGKEELYLRMMHADLEEAHRLHQQGIDLDGTCRQRLRVLTGAFLAAPREQRDVIRLVRRDINIFGGQARNELVRAYQAALPELVTQIIADGIAGGELLEADPRLARVAVRGAGRGDAVRLRRLGPGRRERQAGSGPRSLLYRGAGSGRTGSERMSTPVFDSWKGKSHRRPPARGPGSRGRSRHAHREAVA